MNINWSRIIMNKNLMNSFIENSKEIINGITNKKLVQERPELVKMIDLFIQDSTALNELVMKSLRPVKNGNSTWKVNRYSCPV